MSSLSIRIFVEETGFGATFAWENEVDYQLGREFLSRGGAKLRPADGTGENGLPRYYLETEQQYLDFLNFRRSLREKAKR